MSENVNELDDLNFVDDEDYICCALQGKSYVLFEEGLGEIKEKSISANKGEEPLGEKPSSKEIRDMAWRTYA